MTSQYNHEQEAWSGEFEDRADLVSLENYLYELEVSGQERETSLMFSTAMLED